MAAADTEDARGNATGDARRDGQGRERWAAFRAHPGWAGHLANAALILSVAAVGAVAVISPRSSTATSMPAAAIVIVAFAVVLGALVGVARWTYAALAGRVDILTQALDASPDPQLILTPDGRIAYANTAYRELFPAAHERPMPAIAAALADLDAMPDFERLRSRAAQGARAIAALPLRYSRGSAVGWFTISVNPIAGRPGYSFWNIQDITARHEMEALIRDERNKLVEFLNDAPVGFYSVDGGRAVSVRQPDARGMARARRLPRSSAATPACTISSPSRRRQDAASVGPVRRRATMAASAARSPSRAATAARCRPG